MKEKKRRGVRRLEGDELNSKKRSIPKVLSWLRNVSSVDLGWKNPEDFVTTKKKKAKVARTKKRME